jgi:hypothetical protein
MKKHTILFLAANPTGTSQLALGEQARAIQHELDRSGYRDHFELETRWAAQPLDLLRELRKLKPTVVHFSGHGSGASGLYFQGHDGRPQAVSAQALHATFGAAGASVQLVVLSACYSDAQADALREYVDCVVGMSGAVRDAAARSFAIGFYGGLGERESVEAAFRQGCAAIALEGLRDSDLPKLKVREGVDARKLVLAERSTRGPDPASGAGAGAGASSSPSAPYDLFLAHPSASKASARALYELLQPDVRVFLDERSLSPGARWDLEIPAAQRASRATVILISSHADAAWYLGDEIVTAIRLSRAAPEAHAVVPVLLEQGLSLPYGLSHIQAIDAAAEGGLAGVAARLRQVAARTRNHAVPLPAVPEIASRGDGACDHVRLHARLSRLPDTIFEEILLYARIDRSQIAPRVSKLADRCLDVAQLAAVDVELCRRIAAELDRRRL